MTSRRDAARELDSFSTSQLLEELQRRQNAVEATDEITDWCEDCAHFRFWNGRSEPPKTYNPCGKRHQVRFRTPKSMSDVFDNCGFYRLVCEDRKPRSSVGNETE